MYLTLKITVSFKESEKKLYDWVKEHSSYAGFIKDLIKAEMEKEKNWIKKLSQPASIQERTPKGVFYIVTKEK